jgi:hypothetical protein
MENTCEVDVYWTVQNGRRFSISLSEREAWESLKEIHDYTENPQGWTVVHSREKVPSVTGDVVEGEGEIIELNDEADVASRTSFTPVHIFWDCPWCGQKHNTDLYHGFWGRTLRSPNPSIWFCERGEGIVLVKW